MNALDAARVLALDADAGGSYAPSAEINIAGSGLEVETLFTIGTACAMTCEAGSTTSENGTTTFHSAAVCNFLSGSSCAWSAGSTIAIFGAVQIGSSSVVTVDSAGTLACSAGSVVNLAGTTSITSGGALNMNAGSTTNLAGTMAVQGVGHINRRSPLSMSDSNVSTGITNCDFILIPNGVLSGNRDLTINSTGVGVGSVIEIWADNSANNVALKYGSGSAIQNRGADVKMSGTTASGFWQSVKLISPTGAANDWIVIGGVLNP